MAIIDKIVKVTITKTGAAVSVASFGIPLILTTDQTDVMATQGQATALNKLRDDVLALQTEATAVASRITALAASAENVSEKAGDITAAAGSSTNTVQNIIASFTAARTAVATAKAAISTLNPQPDLDTLAAWPGVLDALLAAMSDFEKAAEALTKAQNFVVKRYGDPDQVLNDFEATSDTYRAALGLFGQAPKVAELLIGKVKPSVFSFGNSLANIRKVYDDWYCALPVGKATDWNKTGDPTTELLNVMTIVESLKKICIVQTTNASELVAGTDTLAAKAKKSGFKRSAIIYHQVGENIDADPTIPGSQAYINQQWASAAWAGKVLPYEPGAATWAFKTLATITADNIDENGFAEIAAKNLNVYMTIGGVNVTQDGRSSQGEWLDITVGIDYIHARIQERIYALLAGTPKMSYNDVGISLVGSALLGVLTNAATKGIIEQSSIAITLPAYADLQQQNPNAIEARLLPDIKFTATLIGAIHSVVIDGTVSI